MTDDAKAPTVEEHIEAEFEVLKLKLTKALSDYDHRLIAEIDKCRDAVKAHLA